MKIFQKAKSFFTLKKDGSIEETPSKPTCKHCEVETTLPCNRFTRLKCLWRKKFMESQQS